MFLDFCGLDPSNLSWFTDCDYGRTIGRDTADPIRAKPDDLSCPAWLFSVLLQVELLWPSRVGVAVPIAASLLQIIISGGPDNRE